MDVRREYVARLQSAVQALLSVDGTRQWKVRGLVEQVREEERREAREECDLCVAAADSALAQGEVDEVEQKVEEEPVTQRKDGKAGKPAGKDPKAEKAEKERKEAEKRAKEERERKRKDDKVLALRALGEALKFSAEVGAIAGSEQHDRMAGDARQRGQERLRGEANELLGRMERAEQVENEESERLKVASSNMLSPTAAGRSTTTTQSRPSSATLLSPKSARRPAASAVPASPSSASSAAVAASDLAGFLSGSYGGHLSRLQQLSLFVDSLLGWLDGSDEASVQVRAACELRLAALRRRWEGEVKARQEEEARAAAAAATAPAVKGKGKGK